MTFNKKPLIRAGVLAFGLLVILALILSFLVLPGDRSSEDRVSEDSASEDSTPEVSAPGDSTSRGSMPEDNPASTNQSTASIPASSPSISSTTQAPSTTQPPDYWVDPSSVSQPWGEVAGLLTFRGSPTRNYYGQGPIPESPTIAWSYPSQAPMCSQSTWRGSTVEWCGTGWTGQPAVVSYSGRTWVIFGAYDGAVHFLDAETGEQILPSFQTDDLIKGSVTVDPNGYPLIYIGSRDNNFRIIAFDGEEPRELWRMNAYNVEQLSGNRLYWNDDWDSSALVIDDYLFEGGENSSFYIVKLNRSYDDSGLARVSPEILHVFPGWDDQLLEDIADEEISIESSAAIFKNTLYFANSGGLVQGWDISGLGSDDSWQPERVFRFWTGGDVDASIVVDEEGMLYVGVERERLGEKYAKARARTEEVGQIIKLDPSRPDNPVVWSVKDLNPLAANPPDLRTQTGLWATPALYGEMIYAATHTGRLLGIDRDTGAICWEIQLDGFLWGSPVVVDDVLLQGDVQGALRAYDVSGDAGCEKDAAGAENSTAATSQLGLSQLQPPQLWSVPLGWRIESTPAVWGGTIFLGDRNGRFYALK